MIWLILILTLAVVFGIGAVLKAALWLLVPIAVVAVAAVVAVTRLVGGSVP